jgi:Fe-S cluster assembly protein SufD
MSRGIPDAEAEALLIQAFIGEVIEEIAHEGIREALMNAAVAWLEKRAGTSPAMTREGSAKKA